MIGSIRNWGSMGFSGLNVRHDRLRNGVELVLAVIVLVQLGLLGWTIIDPVAKPVASPERTTATRPIDYSVFQRFDAFFRTGGQSSLAEASAAGSSQIRLFGLRAGGAGGGSAIIGLADGRQVSVGVGDEIEPGLVLHSVGMDHVTLARGSSLTRLIFADAPVGAAPPPPPPSSPQTVTPQPAAAPAAAAGPSVDPARLMAQAGLRPRMQGLRVNGFTVSGAGDGTALKAAGLRPGDVILAVNGQSLDSIDRIAALRGQLAGSASAEIRFERGGAVETTTIRTGR